MKKTFSNISLFFKSCFMPAKYYPVIMEKPISFFLISTLLFQVSLSVLMVMIIANSPDPIALMGANSADQVMNTLYITIIIIPLVALLPSMYFSWIANNIGGKGGLFKYFKLIIWSLPPSILMIFLAGLLVSITSLFIEPSKEILLFFMALQLIPIIIYFVVSLKVSHNITYIKSLLSYAIGIGFIYAAKMIFF
jgi:hypothetical protein